jgi:alkylation response protein AidB-like acyl-CoA dehydrogenase
MRPLPDALQDELQAALRQALRAPQPVDDVLTALGLHDLETDPAAGGLGLGLTYGVVVAEELGRAAADDTYGPGCPAAASPAGFALTAVRIRQAAYLVGLAAGAHELAVRRTAERRQFGRAIAAFQATGFTLANDAVRIESARLLTAYAAWLADGAQPDDWPPADGDPELAALQALATAAETSTGVVRRALHLHGTFGLIGDHPIQRYYRLAAAEAVRWGHPAALWRAAGRLRAPLAPRTEAVLVGASGGAR